MYNSERILACRSLIMEDVNFWEEDLKPDNPCDNVQKLMQEVARLQIEIQESSLDDDSREVATTIAGYISKKLQTRSKCTSCSKMLIADKDGIENDKYLNILSRGRMTVPSTDLADFVDDCFAILDYISPLLVEHKITNVRDVCSRILNRYGPKAAFVCEDHVAWGMKFASKPIINIFFNNKEKLCLDTVRKDAVAEFKALKRSKR